MRGFVALTDVCTRAIAEHGTREGLPKTGFSSLISELDMETFVVGTLASDRENTFWRWVFFSPPLSATGFVIHGVYTPLGRYGIKMI